MPKTFCFCSSPAGGLTLVEEDGVLTAIVFGRAILGGGVRGDSPLLRRTREQLGQHFTGQRKTFELPYRLTGTPFQMRVWEELCKIPYGETRSYADIAIAVERPGAGRAIGMAAHRNPIPLIVPCHRVVGADGSLTGYGGGLGAKRLLLTLEQRYSHADEGCEACAGSV